MQSLAAATEACLKRAMTEPFVYKALRPEEVAPSLSRGSAVAAIDEADGFVHLSSASQIADTLALHFAGLDGILLCEFRTADLGEALTWEPSRGGDLFPHLYGPLQMDAATRRWTLGLDEAGRPVLPEDL